MFIGHFAVGLAAKKLDPKPSLGTYFLAAQLLDLLWPTFLLLGLEKAEISQDASHPIPLLFTHYPWSHSLLAVTGWAVLFGVGYFVIKNNRKGALVLGLAVMSHWFLDLLVHVEDLPLYPGGSPLMGLGLWKFKIPVLLIELLFFAAALWIYLRTTVAKNKTGVWATWSLFGFLLLVHVMNTFGSAPPSIEAVAWVGELQWLFVLWAFWADSKRENRFAVSLSPSGKTSAFTAGSVKTVTAKKQHN